VGKPLQRFADLLVALSELLTQIASFAKAESDSPEYT
jgi:hypothetical protein